MTDWQTIDSAPRDGTRILAFRLGAKWIAIAHWERAPIEGLHHDWQWRILDRDDFPDEDPWIEDWCSSTYDPTHWMPLPPLPENGH